MGPILLYLAKAKLGLLIKFSIILKYFIKKGGGVGFI